MGTEHSVQRLMVLGASIIGFLALSCAAEEVPQEMTELDVAGELDPGGDFGTDLMCRCNRRLTTPVRTSNHLR